MSPANLNNPFGESCCDGGECGIGQSAQPCGCDMGHRPPHFCEQHKTANDLKVLKAAVRKLIDADIGGEAGPDYYAALNKVIELL